MDPAPTMTRPPDDVASAYYPPRARWYGTIFCVGDWARRRLALDKIRLPPGMSLSGAIAGFLVPGIAIWLTGRKLRGTLVFGSIMVLMFVFVAWLGYPAANIAFGLLISVHTAGFVYYCRPILAGEEFGLRLAFTVMMLLIIGLVVYMPARVILQGHWLVPLQSDGHVIVVRRMGGPGKIVAGEWVAYRLSEDAQGDPHAGGAVRVQAGMGFGPVLAVAGDLIRFSTNSFFVNGNSNRSLPHMPSTGELTVPENHWFIWPNLGINGHGNVNEARINETFLNMANVDQNQFFGRPFHRWFWRKQIFQ